MAHAMIQSDIPQVIHDFFAVSEIPLTLTDPNISDDPIVLANSAFYRMSGFTADDILGKNCRFMQGPETQDRVRKTISGDLMANRDSQVLIRNYRKTGEAFDNFLFIFTVLDTKGQAMFRIGSQFEVPEIGKHAEFDAHATRLRDGINNMNAQVDAAQQQLVNTGALVGLTVKSLIMARLEALKAA